MADTLGCSDDDGPWGEDLDASPSCQTTSASPLARARFLASADREAREKLDREVPNLRLADTRNRHSKFTPVEWRDISFQFSDEWLVKRVLPRRGLAALYGGPGSFKSFVALHLAVCAATGSPWGNRKTSRVSVVYIAAEGASGLLKRRAGLSKALPGLPPDVDFHLISAAPNLGTESGDRQALISAIKDAGIEPGLIVVDTLSRSLCGANENAEGMAAFIGNAGELERNFGCLVLAVHHVGVSEEAQKRMRGSSAFGGAVDAQILWERSTGEPMATLTIQKVKDEADDIAFVASLERVVLGNDRDGDEVSTLAVMAIKQAQKVTKVPKAKAIPASERLLFEVIREALRDVGQDVQQLADVPPVRAVSDEAVRRRYFSRIAEKREPGDDPKKFAERHRKAFNRAFEAALKAKRLIAADYCRFRRSRPSKTG